MIVTIAGWLWGATQVDPKAAKLARKGERIVHVMCQKEKLPSKKATLEETMQAIDSAKACRPLSHAKRRAVAYFIQYGSTHTPKEHIHVPSDAKCPVCGMFVSKYPKWAAVMQVGQERYYFDGVKDMMKYYIFDGNFPFDRKEITSIGVSDYYTLEEIPAKEAYYVLDPNVYGPMGHELVPFKYKRSAEGFMQEHHGKRIVRFDEITDRMLMALDGITQ